jgi:hypothetical protein
MRKAAFKLFINAVFFGQPGCEDDWERDMVVYVDYGAGLCDS